MRTQIRIVAGSLRGRKLTCTVTPKLRPTPQMVREALFSILGNAVPDRPFWDVFAGTGVVGIEALSRGASVAYFIERDFRFADAIDEHLKQFGVTDRGRVVRADVYRWAERLPAITEPVTVFVSPPFADYQHRPAELLALLSRLQLTVPVDSVICLQGEQDVTPEALPHHYQWDKRRYGRNELWFWNKESNPERNGHAAEVAAAPQEPAHDGT
jgi:16S rRNA (guanine(966)-N(2))-methyltransferase RsmD